MMLFRVISIKSKFEAEERLDSLRNEREELVNKYFK